MIANWFDWEKRWNSILKLISAKIYKNENQATVKHIYQPLRPGRIWHEVNF